MRALAWLGGHVLFWAVWSFPGVLAFFWLRNPVRVWPDAAAAVIAVAFCFLVARLGNQMQPGDWLRRDHWRSYVADESEK